MQVPSTNSMLAGAFFAVLFLGIAHELLAVRSHACWAGWVVGADRGVVGSGAVGGNGASSGSRALGGSRAAAHVRGLHR